MPAHTTELTSQGITLNWGTTQIGVTRMSYSGSSVGEVDITSMKSGVITDPNNTNNKRVKKSVDYAVIDMGEISCDFFGPHNFSADEIGTKRSLSVSSLGVNGQAYLTSVSSEVVAGEFVRGSCTFKLSDD